jgi:peptidoglycan/LPS O-acetylase OafA/YrhL
MAAPDRRALPNIRAAATVAASMPNLLAIQVLRAVAAIAVVIAHAGLDLNYFGRLPPENTVHWAERGNSGVDLFFVISGFIMVYISGAQFATRGAPLNFFARRLIRIVPLYWIVTTGYVIATSFPAVYALCSYFFIPAARPNGAMLPVVLQGWTLNFEMFFYLLFAVAIVLPRRLAVVALTVVMSGFVIAGVPYYGNPIILEFVFGMFIALARAERLRLPTALCLLLIAAGIAAFLVGLPETGGRVVTWGIPAALIVAGATLGAPLPASPAIAPLVAIGDASYALYLVHPLMTRWIAGAARPLGIDLAQAQAGYLIVAVAASILFGLVVYRIVEKPLLRVLHRMLLRPAQAAAAG